MRKIPLTTFLLFAFLGASCTSAPPEPEVSPEAMKSEYETALESAKQAYKKVDDVGFAWRDTEEMIQKSEDTAKGGDYAGASKLAKKAERQSTNAWEQYLREKDAGPRF